MASMIDNTKGLYPRGMTFPNVMEARRARRVGHRYLTVSNREGRLGAHRDPLCTRMKAESKLVAASVFDYGTGQLIAFRNGDDPVFVDECSFCKDVAMLTRQDGEWRKHAACNVPGLDLSEHFLNPGRDTSFAQELCEECPVRVQCLEYGIKLQPEKPRGATVIWGGEKL